MLASIRKKITQELWERYLNHCPKEAALIQTLQMKLQRTSLPLDHFAIIDLPSLHSGIPTLQLLFTMLGYVLQGRGYLPEKQNEFAWLTCMDAFNSAKENALPQIVVADFKLEVMPLPIQNIINRYTQHIKPPPFELWFSHRQKSTDGDQIASELLMHEVLHYLCTPQWPMPTVHDIEIVKKYNELLAWVLVHGKRVNHFTIGIHLLDVYANLADFHHELVHYEKLYLNKEGGAIKGCKEKGVEQSSTISTLETIQSGNESIHTTCGFLEFIWRYQKNSSKENKLWCDYYSHFIAHQASFVIESLNQSVS